MRLIVTAVLLLVSIYVCAYPSHEHSGHNHPDHHISARNAHDNNESATHTDESEEEEGDVDTVSESIPDNELEEIVAHDDCVEGHNKNEEEPVVEEHETHAKLSLKDQQRDHKVGKRSAPVFEGHGRHGVREKRSESEGDPHDEGYIHSEEGQDFSESDHQEHPDNAEHSNRKRRDAEEDPDLPEHSEHSSHSHEEPHHYEKRSSGHHRDHIHKRDVEESAHEDEPTFASDDVHQVDSVALRVKRVSRAGSSHKPRVMNKNKGNSRAGPANPTNQAVE
ncbi:hypothetical protein OSTOST_16468 [Ostertagia ostertagi]